MFFFQEDSFEELPELLLYFQETNFFCNIREKKKIYDLFNYLVKRNYNQEAAELWDNVIFKKTSMKVS